ncbi:hypothetical protein [Candidatus Phytoplasma sacchari]|uniref:Uncharacterized protein n=1 Tax=Candidatus Phytoplasma sacchari TaxID=2609813 RepID=A0ABY7M0R2_9MOLU|nr:hypothetical protein O7R10_01075 [Candidatus Phytoplasma sacchari]WBL31191.1 hypothetical protein O7R10_01080 [Candidatus Phytoplasma sacchari]WBL31192.1 hypothetical protein O7R10_01085 [Candidatus Phytoplasma sacchari]WBL31194.1 hypothetical protein O7R10_01095 [Candidatus Phytoplasma sacchari]WBL31197.1 hypothetical protein O7R10_01110 [Candidatus Phytoplasma sacchari]
MAVCKAWFVLVIVLAVVIKRSSSSWLSADFFVILFGLLLIESLYFLLDEVFLGILGWLFVKLGLYLLLY